MNRLSLILAAIVALGGVFAGGQLLGDKRGYARAQGEYAVAYAEAEAAAAEQQKALMRAVERVAENAEQERNAMQSRLTAADDSVERLRQTIRDANARADPGAPGELDAARARSLLAECTGKYRDMAHRADKLRATVIGLQDYVRALGQGAVTP
ncbi:hypothetical protein SAMN04488005_1496 [Yoonia tamlensis]|uniref:Uncharacterized protein n=1 Tax=Yoonia tamlensis TaxID=390270 RepID=A0A1I6GE33_9RHOB|nr:hypothetical protein [Yoonia tamlensis]SFR40418.1 hypothetical protein SAMN04488005_1496 [Yoonia tamlensis]